MSEVLCIYNILTNLVSAYCIFNENIDKKEAMDNIFYYMLACKQNGNIVMDVVIDYNNVNNIALAKECKKQLKLFLSKGD